MVGENEKSSAGEFLTHLDLVAHDVTLEKALDDGSIVERKDDPVVIRVSLGDRWLPREQGYRHYKQ